MLKKEKKKVQEASAQIANFSSREMAFRISSSSSTPAEKRLTGETSESFTHTQHLKGRPRGPALSMGRQEAFEIFRRDHEDRLTIEDNKAILKQRFAEAKALGEQVNQARNRVNELKKQVEVRRMQIAAEGVVRNEPDSESDPVEERLRNQIEEEKKSYKSTFGRLKGLKTEIEHLQHLLQKSKIRLQRDFQDWWTQEASRLQKDQKAESAEVRQSQESSLYTSSSSSYDQAVNSQEREHSDLSAPSPRELRALSSSGLKATSIPMTGDQQTDADILAFIKARQSLLTRSGLAPK